MTTTLLVVDAQESFRARPDDWATVSDPDVADRIGELAGRARAGGHDVVWVFHTEPGTGTVFDPAHGYVRPLAGLVPEPGEPSLTKTVHNAFTGTDLDDRLRARGTDEVVVCGLRTEQCCETTARVASDLGYRVTFVLDATATMALPRWHGSGSLDPGEVQERTAAALHGRFGRVTTTAGLSGF
ncbi:cysteine hydrolase family protein [Pseudonocardia sp. HH130630-07]|uniref:cysteine hydrolase family protein n=1 Tax=Pseudonocardia sp. HH130630-07 TaxID=1690815 RepID=UPI000814E4F5|nr:isochorismatase family protein [Pseudonocardia sp. HH130630-07]ANY08855.1 isochorismatase [Pseudonocardia sp. HH130630-07]